VYIFGFLVVVQQVEARVDLEAQLTFVGAERLAKTARHLCTKVSAYDRLHESKGFTLLVG